MQPALVAGTTATGAGNAARLLAAGRRGSRRAPRACGSA
jgi:hypothetical protein